MIRKTRIVMLTSVAVWTTIEAALNGIIKDVDFHPFWFHWSPDVSFGFWAHLRGAEIGWHEENPHDFLSPKALSVSFWGFSFFSGKSAVYGSGGLKWSYELHAMECPSGFAVLLLGIYPVITFIRRPLRRRRRMKRGLCVHCGYNLTGNVSGVCTECGRPISEGASKVSSDPRP